MDGPGRDLHALGAAAQAVDGAAIHVQEPPQHRAADEGPDQLRRADGPQPGPSFSHFARQYA